MGLSRPSPNGPLLVADGPLPSGGLPPSSYSALGLLRGPPLRAVSVGCLVLLLANGDGGVGGWWPP